MATPHFSRFCMTLGLGIGLLGVPLASYAADPATPAKSAPNLVLPGPLGGPLFAAPLPEVQDERKVPADKSAAPPAKPEADKAAKDGAVQTFVDPEFGNLLPAGSATTGKSAAADSWLPRFDYGGEVRSRYAQDLYNETALVARGQGQAPKKEGREDVIDFRNSFRFWTKLDMKKRVQAFLEVYAEHVTVARRNENKPTVIFNGRDYRYTLDIQLKEAYAAYLGDSFDIKVGRQIVPWGTLAVMSPSDRVNPRDPRAYYWSDVSGTREPVLAAKGVYHYQGLSFEAIWIPFFKNPPADLYGGDFSLMRYGAAYATTPYPIPDIDRYIARSKSATEQPDWLTTRRAPDNFVSSQAGVRISGSKAGFDFGLSYLFSFDELPTTRMDPELRALSQALLSQNSNLSSYYISDIAKRIANGEPLDRLLRSEFKRKHSVAAEFGWSIWEIGLKAEAAFLADKTYYRTDLTPVDRHTLSYAAGVDVMKTDLLIFSTFYLDVELFGSSLFGMKAGERLFYSTAHNLGLHAQIKTAFLRDKVELELITQTHFNTKDYLIIPRIRYSPIKAIDLIAGVMLLDSWGKEPKGYTRFSSNDDRKDALFGSYSENDQLFVMMRYHF